LEKGNKSPPRKREMFLSRTAPGQKRDNKNRKKKPVSVGDDGHKSIHRKTKPRVGGAKKRC